MQLFRKLKRTLTIVMALALVLTSISFDGITSYAAQESNMETAEAETDVEETQEVSAAETEVEDVEVVSTEAMEVNESGAMSEPETGTTYTYDFTSGIISSTDYITSFVSEDGLWTLNGEFKYNDPHGIVVKDATTLEVKVAGDAEIQFAVCAYSQTDAAIDMTTELDDGESCTYDSNLLKSGTDGETITFTYTGAARTLTFEISSSAGTSYIHKMVVKNADANEESPVANEQTAMPGILVEDNLSVKAIGHRLYLSNSDSTSKNSDLSKPNGYYLFDGTAELNEIEADILITSVGSSSSYGITAGIYEESNSTVSRLATIALRGDNSLRNFYSKSTGSIGAGGINATWALGDRIHVKIKKNESKISFVAVTPDGTEYAREDGYSSSNVSLAITDKVRFGFGVSNADAVITNLVYKDASGNVLYDQNDCYEAVGEAPNVASVEKPVISEDRLSISVNWEGDDCKDDGAYKVELSSDDGDTYITLSEAVTEKTYTASISDSGRYRFRISGICGSKTTQAVASEAAILQAPLGETTVSAESSDSAISLSWTKVEGAETYEIYRMSSEETEYTLIATVETLSYEDTNLVNETPYYYYIVCKSADNTSNGSEVILTLPSAGHVGEYVYDEEAVEITITKKSYDTVYTNKAALEGVSEGAGTIELVVNGSVQDTKEVGVKGKFAFEAVLQEGRNDVELHLTDSKGKITRKIYNFVYLTNYDIIVDCAYTGTDGEESDTISGVKVYSTVQAAVNSVSSSNTDRVIILVKTGDYFEHLTVSSPYITLIGEDRELTRIYYCDETTVGGDTSTRCATYITKTATGFSAENITFENSYEYKGTESNGSADAIRVDANQSTFVNVKFLGYQDTLQANSNKQYYYKCYITGNVDYIYGTDGQALFNDCDLVFRYHSVKNSGYVTAPKTSASLSYGYIFNNCRIVAEEGCTGTKYLLARPWGADASATFINCYMSSVIYKTFPYADMSGNAWKAARFSEYYTYGKGFLINTNRPQISSSQAATIIETSSLGWDPYTVITTNAAEYVGSIVTTTDENYIEKEYDSDTANPDDTNDAGLGNYGLSGYADGYGTTGGGLLLETSDNYYKASNAEEFLRALSSIKKSGKKSVIEITKDIALGTNEIGDLLEEYSSIISSAITPITHPTLMETGVSKLSLKEMANITIFSQNGSSILHTCININASKNIIIRNIKFDELWEWDEGHSEYDRNDWDYITIESGSTGIWIDHCTFYKAYDGIADVKKANADDTMDVTISWCEFLPESEDGTFFNTMMEELENNKETYPYYASLLDEGMTKAQIRAYAAGQKKTHLVGASDTEANYENLNVTLAYNYYKDSMDRMPRMRGGNSHVYNCVMDSTNLYNLKQELRAIDSVNGTSLASKIVSNGSLATCDSKVLVHNTSMINIECPAQSGNMASPGGYIAALNSLHTLGSNTSSLEINYYSEEIEAEGKVLDVDGFLASLPYEVPALYDATTLETNVVPYTGAGKVTMNYIQWLKTEYNENVEVIDVTDVVLDHNTITFDTIGASQTIKATVVPADAVNKTVEWTSSDTKVATVSGGVITAVGNGTATIKATVGSISAACEVTVAQKVTSFGLDKTSLTFDTIGASQTLKSTVAPSNAANKTVTWSSSNAKVVTVSNGKITAVGNGTATITAKAGDKTATCNVTVSQKVTKVGLQLNNQKVSGTIKVQKGQSYSFKAVVTPSNADSKNAKVTWTTSNKKRATVSSEGKVKVVGTGKVTITAKTADGKTAKVTLNATTKVLKVSNIKVSGSKTMKVKAKQTLSLTISPVTAKNQNVTWKSSDSKIATVNSKGVVTAKKAGKVTITATAKDGSNKKATIKITVKK
ncbi:pectinesterase family protein [Konateibacter massiliensis]|uniref:pectinesterase family protein n=1 Tax=Konateibacter massiliensis TaxID=2002841 RepID=UPI000C14D7E5|nr:pectinesterase family protein [Konateibacter massiliensis]